MLGNDIVAWDAAPNRGAASRARFVQRVFSPYEQTLIAASARPDFTLWLLWGVKESVHKAVSRFQGALVFSPVRVVVDADGDSLAGRARLGDFVYAWQAEEGRGWVHVWACATTEALAHVRRRVARLPVDESLAVRRLALTLLSELHVASDAIEGRPPEVFCRGQRVPGLVSLSHDEGYGAVVWLAP